MAQFTERTLVPEMMDEPDADRDDLARSLAFIRFVNARLGGASAAIGHIKRWLPRLPRDRPIRIIDLATGSADIPIAIARWARRRDIDVHITGIDLHETTLQLAREHLARQRDQLPIDIVAADALKLTDQFEPDAFDIAHTGMFLHHLPDIEAMTVLRIMDRLSACGLIWNDLIRGTAGRIGVRCLLRLIPRVPAMARHDAVVSVDAGFTRAEAMNLADRAGLENIRYRTHLFYRFTLTSETPDRQ